MIIYCNNVIPPEKQDKHIVEKMLKEKNAILQWALIAFQHLANNNFRFDEPKAMKENRQKYEEENNSLVQFVEECCYVSDTPLSVSSRVKRSDFNIAYEKWLKSNNKLRGKIPKKERQQILEEKYGEKFMKDYNGNYATTIMFITAEAKAELGLWF